MYPASNNRSGEFIEAPGCRASGMAQDGRNVTDVLRISQSHGCRSRMAEPMRRDLHPQSSLRAFEKGLPNTMDRHGLGPP